MRGQSHAYHVLVRQSFDARHGTANKVEGLAQSLVKNSTGLGQPDILPALVKEPRREGFFEPSDLADRDMESSSAAALKEPLRTTASKL